MRTSTYTYSEAINEVKVFLAGENLNWNGEKYVNNYSIEESSADSSAFPCPRELGSWSGEVNAIYVYRDYTEEVFAVAYWSDSPLPDGYTMEQSISGYWRLLDSEGNYILDDPACDDVYDEEAAIAFFREYIKEL